MNKNTYLLAAIAFLSSTHITCSFALERSEDSPIIFKPVARLATSTPPAAQSADSAHTPGSGTPLTIASRPLSISPHSAFRPYNTKRQSPDETAPEHDDSVALSLHPTTTDFQASTDTNSASSSAYPATCAMPDAAITPAAKVRKLHDNVPALVFIDETPQASSSNGTTTSPLSALLTVVARAGREERTAAPASSTAETVATRTIKEHTSAPHKTDSIVETLICPFSNCTTHVTTPHNLYAHIRGTHGDKYIDGAWACDYCGQRCKAPCELMDHVYKKHRDESLFICPTCGKKYRTMRNLATHRHRCHEAPQYHCIFCYHEAAQPSHWKQHLLSHLLKKQPKLRNDTDEPIFACPCGTGFSSVTNLDAHECAWIPTGVFLCPCGKMFKHLDWNKHQKTCPRATWPSKS